MGLDSGDFLERVNNFLKKRIEARFAQAPTAEQVEFHFQQCEEKFDRFLIDFVYEISWLKENDERHNALDDKAKKRLAYLQKLCEDLGKRLTEK